MAVGVAEAAGHITLATIAAFLMAVALSTLDQPEVPPPPTARYLEHLRQASAIISDVPRLQFSELQEAAFYRELVLRSQPAIIEGWITTGWPASSLWTASYLTRAAGHVGIQVESIGADAHVFDPEDLRRGGEDRYHTMGLGEFLVAYQQPGRARNYYAAEVPLPAELAAEVHPPPWVTMPLDPSVAQPALWIGGPNHTTPIHRDMYENVYCMVRGAKHFYLAAPWEADRMYPEEERSHWSRVRSVEAYDRATFPLFGAIEWISLTVRAGECAFIPSFWWHHVTSLETTIAASFWYPTVEHNPLWAETMQWALQEARSAGPQPLFDATAAPLPADACRGAATVSALPAELAEFAGVYQLLRDVSSGGDPVFGRRCNDASRHRHECESYLYRLDTPPRWVLGPTPGVDRAVMHAELPPGRQVQHAREWMGWIEDAWHEIPTVRVHCTHREN